MGGEEGPTAARLASRVPACRRFRAAVAARGAARLRLPATRDSTGGRRTRDRPAASSSDAAPPLPPSPFPTNARAQGGGGGTVPSLRRCSCGQRRRDVPNARIGVGQGCAAAGAFHSSRRTLLRSDCRQRHGLHRHEPGMRWRGQRHLGHQRVERHEGRCLLEDQRRRSRSGRSPSRPTARRSPRLAQALSRPADMRTQSSRSIRRRSP